MKKSSFHVLIDLSAPETHRARVRITAAADELPPVLQFPVWTPGSYLVREYSRHVTRLEPAEKISKNEWRLRGRPRSVSYEVYCFERSVRTSFLDTTHAALVGATLLPLLHAPFELELRLPRGWEGVSSALRFRKRGAHSWVASVGNDDDWIDKPIIAWSPGHGSSARFRLRGITHHVAWAGQAPGRPLSEIAHDLSRIAAATLKLFGSAPFKEYWFLLHFGTRMYGGLEHRDSQLSQFDGLSLREPAERLRFLKLIAHEYFHSWNVKAIRPLALGPFNYFAENYTQDIWFAEGLTDYFDDIIPLEAKLFSKSDHDKGRLRDISAFPDGHPGHFRRSLAESSFDAWIRYYRSDEDSVNTDVSYYGKGAILGWCWDAQLRRASRGRWTLARLMREIYKEFGVPAAQRLHDARPGFTRDELLRFCEKRTGIRQRALVEGWVCSRKPLPWRKAARFFGLKFREETSNPLAHFLGILCKWEGRASVASVLAGGAGEAGGVSALDELLAVNSVRVQSAEQARTALRAAMHAGPEVELLLCRQDRVLTRRVRWRRHEGIGVELVPLGR